MMADPKADQKRAAAERAVEWVESGMTVGLGTGSTAVWAIRAIGAALADGRLRDIVGVPTSTVSEHDARAPRASRSSPSPSIRSSTSPSTAPTRSIRH